MLRPLTVHAVGLSAMSKELKSCTWYQVFVLSSFFIVKDLASRFVQKLQYFRHTG